MDLLASLKPLSELDVLNQFREIAANKVDKFRFILIPTLLYNSEYLTPIKKFMSMETPVDSDIDKLVLEAVNEIVENESDENHKGWNVERRKVVKMVEDQIKEIGFEFDFPQDLDKMIGVVMFALQFVPAKQYDSVGWKHCL